MPPTVFFITDAQGKRESRETLVDTSRWLWFRPDLISDLVNRRGGHLSWYTRDTGSVGCSPESEIHFGVNQLGLVTVFAKDIAELPDWEQRIWAGHNVSPDGKVSNELLDSQMRVKPADTNAPEAFLGNSLMLLASLSAEKYGFSITHSNPDIGDLVKRTHRFRATDLQGLLSLAKDLARLTADILDEKALKKLLPGAKKELKSLKLLEGLLAKDIGHVAARRMLGPLFGIYDLRHGDAHLSSNDFEAALTLASVNSKDPFVFQGFQLLDSCVSTLYSVLITLFPDKLENLMSAER